MPRLSRRPSFGLTAALLALTLTAGCVAFGETGSDRAATPSPGVGGEPSPPGARGGAPSDDCVNGWTSPPRGSAFRNRPLRIIERTMDLRRPLVPTEMRFFVGPESPPAEKGYLRDIKRWYVKAYLKGDPSFRGRWIVEEREFGSGVAAVAPYRTHGFRSPDWVGFQYEAADPKPRAYPGLPGRWAGTPYDFVEGGAGLTIRGLPRAVAGCLRGS